MSSTDSRTSAVEVRTAIAIISSGPQPDVTTTVDELERQGQPVILVCLDGARHDHGRTRSDVMHLPLLSAGIAATLVIHVIRSPGRTLRLVLRLLRGMTSPRLGAAVLVRVPTAIHLARVLPRRGVDQIRGLGPVGSRLASIVTELSERMPPDLTELPVDWSRLKVRRVGVRWFTRRINSIAAEVSVDSGEGTVIVKRQRSHAGGSAADRFAHEHRVLRTLAEVMGEDVLRVPRVLLSDEKTAMLVMERARGTALDALFAAAGADHTQSGPLADGIRGAGRWLAAMQAATRRESDGGALLDAQVSRAIEDVSKLAAIDRGIRRHRRAIVARLETLHSRLRDKPLTLAGHHDDYWPGNIFFDGERVTVIDFESFRDGFALEDVAYFLFRCELLQRRFRVALPDLSRVFFEGYSPRQPPDADALQLFTITKGLRTLANGMGLDLPMPQRIWTRRTIRGAVLRALRDPQ